MTDDALDIVDYYALLATQNPGKCVYHGPSTLPAPTEGQNERAADPTGNKDRLQHRRYQALPQ
jgi:hypothetical protein